MTGPTEKQLERLEDRHKSYSIQRETFSKIPSSIFSVLGIATDEIDCRYVGDKVSKHYFCGECNITSCSVKHNEIKSHS